jgi:hypothetical protein
MHIHTHPLIFVFFAHSHPTFDHYNSLHSRPLLAASVTRR